MGGFFEGSKKMSKIRLWYGLHNPPNIIKYTEMYTLSGCTGWHVEYISITITMLKSNVERNSIKLKETKIKYQPKSSIGQEYTKLAWFLSLWSFTS